MTASKDSGKGLFSVGASLAATAKATDIPTLLTRSPQAAILQFSGVLDTLSHNSQNLYPALPDPTTNAAPMSRWMAPRCGDS
ncbi:MAG TPA: hypothetical protein DIV79_01305 [Opitutae bacterium]|nr:hypothetical protein [Opitutaceae bacterium]HCR28640.1 hypothetical protein [Opitutae bacterium]